MTFFDFEDFAVPGAPGLYNFPFIFVIKADRAVVFMVSFVFWSLLYCMTRATGQLVLPRRALLAYLSLDPDKQVEWDSRVVSTIHAIVSFILGYICFFVHPESMLGHTLPWQAVFGVVEFRDYALMITSGYLFYDLLLCLRFSSLGDRLILCHHVLILVAFGVGVSTTVGTFYMAALLLNEASTPFTNLNFALASCLLQNTMLYKVNGVCLWVSFLVFRIFFNAYLVYAMIFRAWVPLFRYIDPRFGPYIWVAVFIGLTLLAVGHACLNLVWFAQLTVAVMRKLRRNTARLSVTSTAQTVIARMSTPNIECSSSSSYTSISKRKKKVLNR